MKILINLVILVTACVSSASTVKLTSFRMAANRTRAAEVCGEVAGIKNKFEIIDVIVDPKASDPGLYKVVVNKDGRFCLAVITWSGEVSSRIQNADGFVTSNTIKLTK